MLFSHDFGNGPAAARAKTPGIQRTAKKFHRSVETVRTILQQHNALVSQGKIPPFRSSVYQTGRNRRPSLCEEISTATCGKPPSNPWPASIIAADPTFTGHQLGMIWKLQGKEIETVESEEFTPCQKKNPGRAPSLFTECRMRQRFSIRVLRREFQCGFIRAPNYPVSIHTRTTERPVSGIDTYYRQISQVMY